MKSHSTGKAINKAQRIAGIDMRFLGMTILMPVLVDSATGSWEVAVGLFLLMCGIGRWLSRKDPNIARIAMTVYRQRALYDPLKREYFRMKVEA